jgi:hypothetical protein
MDYWEWLGRLADAIGVMVFFWAVCLAIAAWIGGAPKAKRPLDTNAYRDQRYIPVYAELSGMARIRAELAQFLINPAGPVLHDFRGLIVAFALATFYIAMRLRSVNHPPPRLGRPLFEALDKFDISADIIVMVIVAWLILIYLTRIIWKLKP